MAIVVSNNIRPKTHVSFKVSISKYYSVLLQRSRYILVQHTMARLATRRTYSFNRNTTADMKMAVLLVLVVVALLDYTIVQNVDGFLLNQISNAWRLSSTPSSSLSSSTNSGVTTGSAVILAATEDYLDDLANGDNSDMSNNNNNETSATSPPPSYEYLDDVSLKEPESYLDDLGGPSRSSNNNEEETSSSDRVDEVTPYLQDLSSSSSSSNFTVPIPDTTVSVVDPETALTSLLQLGAATGRGEFATETQKQQASNFINVLEQSNPTPEPTKSPIMLGRWNLLYSNSQLFRSSPFFMAGRAVCSTDDQAKQYDWFCDMHRKALAISTIGQVRQVVSETRLTSEFEVQVGAVPFLSDFTPFAYSGGWPVSIDGSIVSSADITPTETGSGWEIFMDTVKIKGSNIPLLRQVLDNGLMLASRQLGSFLEDNIDGYTNPKPIFETTYLSETLRISRDQDGKVFVYGKESDDTTPTDYSNIDSDLGLLKLLEGFNDAVVKFYI
jgi:PAP_fibrillin